MNKPEVVGYLVCKNGKPVGGEDSFTLDDFTEYLRDNPGKLKLEPAIMQKDHEAAIAERDARIAELEKVLEMYVALGISQGNWPELDQALIATDKVLAKHGEAGHDK